MKSFIYYKLPLLLLTLGGALILAPQASAQSEIAPDHFDGTDSWAAAAVAKVPAKAGPRTAPAAARVRDSQAATPALQPVAVRSVTAPRRAAQAKRKTSAPKASN
ncbi:MAG TPA: hypothetical protein VKQ28_03485 [Candidatus Acidoferrum sp.]|nr:hypothetical protein [Candidatus Acidoferrum sp.]